MNISQLNNLSESQINNNALEKTYDDLEEKKKMIEEELEENDEFELSNKYKTRIIDSEINSNLTLQILIYFNFCYFFVCFALEISSIVFKIYIYKHDSIRWIKFALEFVWLIIEPIKLYNGYYGNINENVNNNIYNLFNIYFIQFYNLFLFIITLLFAAGIQIFYILQEEVLFPIDYSCMIVYSFIAAIELIISIYTMIYIGNRQSALFKLRNSPVTNQNKREKIKTSKEIEQELFVKFPYLRKANKKNNNDEHLKNN